MAKIDISELEVGQSLPSVSVTFDRSTLVRYAGASTDFNPIHYNDRIAKKIGLDGVVAHGMLTMGTALRVVTNWCGDPAAVVSYSVRFTKPVQVPDNDEGTVVEFGGTIKKIVDDVVTVALTATCGDDKVLGAANAEVRLA